MIDVLGRRIFQGIVALMFVAPMHDAWAQSRQRTPLGTQSPFPSERLKEQQRESEKNRPPEVTPEPLSIAMERAAAAHGGRQAMKDVVDWVAEGVFRLSSSQGERSFPLTLSRKGEGQIQRIVRQPGAEVRQGSDGNHTWDGVAGHYAAARGLTLSFLEAQTVRSVPRFFDSQARGIRLRDLGLKGPHRVVESEETNGRASTFYIEPSGRVAKVEFSTGQSVHMLTGKTVQVIESYVFSDYRMIQGVLTPMKIEHFSNGLKVDAMEFTSVRYNTSVSDNVFRP